MRYVALEDERIIAVDGFGSAALSLAVRDHYIGWEPEIQFRRLRYVTNNQRFCALPDESRPNRASAMLFRVLRRLFSDFLHAYGHPRALVETFTDPMRHVDICYKATNFLQVGEAMGGVMVSVSIMDGERPAGFTRFRRTQPRSWLVASTTHC